VYQTRAGSALNTSDTAPTPDLKVLDQRRARPVPPLILGAYGGGLGALRGSSRRVAIDEQWFVNVAHSTREAIPLFNIGKKKRKKKRLSSTSGGERIREKKNRICNAV